MSFKVLGQTIVVLNSHKVARDLLEKRGTIYSDRPALPSFEMCVITLAFMQATPWSHPCNIY